MRKFISDKKTNGIHEVQMVVCGHGIISSSSIW